VAASLGQLFRGVKLCEPFTARDLWTHCVAVAVAARDLTSRLHVPVGDEAFLAGMIHDVGLIAHLQLWPEKLRQVCEEAKRLKAATPEGQSYAGESFCQIEQRIIGLDHEQLGRGLAERWHFPKGCQEAAGNHHNPSGPNDLRLLVGAVHIADTLCCEMHKGFDLTAIGQVVTDQHLESLGLSRAAYYEAVEQMPARIDEGLSVFG
jgi:HD-like signal output (HDOD) protein